MVKIQGGAFMCRQQNVRGVEIIFNKISITEAWLIVRWQLAVCPRHHHAATPQPRHTGICCSFHNTQDITWHHITVTVDTHSDYVAWRTGYLPVQHTRLYTIHPWDTLSQPFATNFFSLSRNLSFNLGPKQFSFCPPIWYWLLAAAGIGNTFVLAPHAAVQCTMGS